MQLTTAARLPCAFLPERATHEIRICVVVGSPSRAHSALNVWLPLLSPYGEELSEELRASLGFVETPPASGFKGAYCFDWRGPETHPVLREWMRHRALSDPRFDESSVFRGLCPVDLGVHVLEGLLVTRPSLQLGGAASQQSPQAWAKQLRQLRQALQALVVRYEAAAGPAAAVTGGRGVVDSSAARGRGRGFNQQRGAAVTAPALSTQRGVLRELLETMDLQQGIRFGTQCQSAKVLIVALDNVLAQLTTQPGFATAVKPATRKLDAAAGFGKGFRAEIRSRKPAASKGQKAGMTKRERKAFDDLAREGLVGFGAVDPSPQRTAVAVAAAMSLLLESSPGTLTRKEQLKSKGKASSQGAAETSPR